MNTVYRKFQNGKEFMKIMDSVHALSVTNGGIGKVEHSRILYTNNAMMIQSYKDDHVSMPSSKAEFDAAFKTAREKIVLFNDVE